MRRNFIGRLALGALLIAGVAQAQQPADQRPPLGKVAIPGSNYEIVFGMAEWLPGSPSEQHAHPGVVMVYVADGEFWYLIDGQRGQPYRAGDASHVRERAFPGESQGRSAAPVMAVYIVEKEKPAVAAAVPGAQQPAASRHR